jgi:hypothetical protein
MIVNRRSPPDLKSLFFEFADYFDNKLVWSRRGNINKQVLTFFEKTAEKMRYRHEGPYMDIDQVWFSEYSDIELALQHEAHVRDAPKLFVTKTAHSSMYPQEFRQLRDIKALRKILIVYLSEAGESNLIQNIGTWLAGQSLQMVLTSEEYLIIIGRSVRTETSKKPGILFHAYIFAYNRKLEGPITRHLTQASETKLMASDSAPSTGS